MKMIEAAAPKTPYIEPEVIQRLLKLGDAMVLTLAALALLFWPATALSGYESTLAFLLGLLLMFATLLAWRAAGLYEVGRWTAPGRAVLGGLLLAMVVGGALFALGALAPSIGGWRAFAGWSLTAGVWLLISRGALALWARPKAQAGAFRRRIAIVGGGAAAQRAIDTLERSSGLDIEIIGLFDDRDDERSPEQVRRYRKLGDIAALYDYARRQRVDLIVVAIPLAAEQRLMQMLGKLWELPVDIRISGQASQLKLSPRAYEFLGELPLLAVFDTPLHGWSWFVKGALDRVLAALMIVAFSPVLAAVALAIRLESAGPVLFRQKRYGFNNELIEIYKFRSMYVDRCDATASKLVTKDDPRVTKVGRFIRKTSIDELPQLFNVLKGELSLVGPRPHATEAKAADTLYQEVVDGYFARHKVKPGITGWAQVNGWRGETDTHKKIENRIKYDLEYIDNWSLWFDLRILLMTPLSLLSPANARNAY